MSTISIIIPDEVLKKINGIVYEKKQAALSRAAFRPVFTQEQQTKADRLAEEQSCAVANAYTDAIAKEQLEKYKAAGQSPSRVAFVCGLILRGLAEYEREVAATKKNKK